MRQPIKILLVSSHGLSTGQRKALYKRFGRDCIIEMDRSIIGNAKAIVRKYEEGRYHDLVVNSSIEVLEELLKKGIHPIIAKMQRGADIPRDKFLCFKRLVAIERTREEVKADRSQQNRRKIVWWSHNPPFAAEVTELEALFGNIEVIHKTFNFSVEEIADYIKKEDIFKLVVETKSRWLLIHLRKAGIPYIIPYITIGAEPKRAQWISREGQYCRLKGYYYTYRELIEEEF